MIDGKLDKVDGGFLAESAALYEVLNYCFPIGYASAVCICFNREKLPKAWSIAKGRWGGGGTDRIILSLRGSTRDSILFN